MFSFHKPKVYRSTSGCCICKAKSSSSRFTDSAKYEDDLVECFQLPERRAGEICNACVLLVKRWKKLPAGCGRHWRHVVDYRAGPGSKSLVRAKSRANPQSRAAATTGNRNNSAAAVAAVVVAAAAAVGGSNKKPQLKAQVRLSEGGQSPSPSPSPPSGEEEEPERLPRKRRRRKRTTIDEDDDEEIDDDDADDDDASAGVSEDDDASGFVDTTIWKKKRVCCGTIYTGPGGMVMVDPRLLKPCTTRNKESTKNDVVAVATTAITSSSSSSAAATPLSDSSSDSGYDDCSNGSTSNSLAHPLSVP